MRAALFDMDRTLVRRQTASMYVSYLRDRGQASWRDSARVLWWLTQYALGVVDAPVVAKRALESFVGMSETVLAARCEDLYLARVEAHVSDRGRAVVEEHRARGDVLAIVTGASPYIARPLARSLGIPHLVSSELEVDREGRFTGVVDEPLCYGEGKLQRAARLAERLGFRLEEATFYSDSLTDLPLLLRVKEPVAVNPDLRLSRLARRRGWRVERW
jgi:HAD superfamily hydrolase (TIGR01490 family)